MSSYVIIPTDFHIFQRGRYTTNQLFCPPHLWGQVRSAFHHWSLKTRSQNRGTSLRHLWMIWPQDNLKEPELTMKSPWNHHETTIPQPYPVNPRNSSNLHGICWGRWMRTFLPTWVSRHFSQRWCCHGVKLGFLPMKMEVLRRNHGRHGWARHLWWDFPANHVSLPETIQVKKTLQKTVTVFFFQQVNLVEFVIEADRPFSSHSHDTWPEGNIHLYLRAMEYTIYHFHLYLRVEFTLGHFTRGNIIEQQSLQCFWAPLTIAKWWYF